MIFYFFLDFFFFFLYFLFFLVFLFLFLRVFFFVFRLPPASALTSDLDPDSLVTYTIPSIPYSSFLYNTCSSFSPSS
ncbi:MAG: hypothetical protein CMA27_06740 [Euryarchaeota archaeon]|nr:hypothetical protein [Euryarchaeota archaeon]